MDFFFFQLVFSSSYRLMQIPYNVLCIFIYDLALAFRTDLWLRSAPSPLTRTSIFSVKAPRNIRERERERARREYARKRVSRRGAPRQNYYEDRHTHACIKSINEIDFFRLSQSTYEHVPVLPDGLENVYNLFKWPLHRYQIDRNETVVSLNL